MATLQDGEIDKRRQSFPLRSTNSIRWSIELPTSSPPVLAYLSPDCSRKRQRWPLWFFHCRRNSYLFGGLLSPPSRKPLGKEKFKMRVWLVCSFISLLSLSSFHHYMYIFPYILYILHIYIYFLICYIT